MIYKRSYSPVLQQLVRAANTNETVVNVKAYGATGDGVTDDTAAIAAAVVAYRTLLRKFLSTVYWLPVLYFPPGLYVVSDTINLTNIRVETWGIVGLGATLWGKCTGKPMLDLLGSRYFFIHHLNVVGDPSSPPSIGLQCGRVTPSGDAGEYIMDRVYFMGTFSRAGFYALATEVVEFNHCRFWNRHNSASSFCFIFDSANHENITSPFITQTIIQNTALSCNDALFLNCDFRKHVGGPAILYEGGASSEFRGQKFVLCYGATRSDEVLRFTGVRSVHCFDMEMHCETTGMVRCVQIDNTTPPGPMFFRGFRFRDYAPQPSACVLDLTGGSRVLSIFDADIWAGVPTNNVPIFGTGASTGTLLVTGKVGWARDSGTLDVSNSTFTGWLTDRGVLRCMFPTSSTGLGTGAVWNNSGVLSVS